MRIAFVGPVPPLRGGISQHGWQIVQALRATGHDVQVESWRSQYPRALFRGEQPSVDAVQAPEGVRFGLRWWNPLSWWAAGRRARTAELVVLAWATPFHGPAQLVVLAATRGVPAVVFVHNPEPHERMPLAGWLLRRLVARCSGAVVHSQEAADGLRSATGIARVEVVGHPLNLPVERTPLPASPPLRLLFLGFVRAYKGVDLAIEAVAEARQNGLDVELTVCGDFWEPVSDYQELIGRLAVEASVELRPGYVPDAALSDLLSRHHAVVAPYRSATVSGVVPLALAAGRPVVVTPVGGLPESVRHGVDGLVSEAVTAESLAAALAQLAEMLPELAAAALAPVDGWEQVASALLQSATPPDVVDPGQPTKSQS